MDIETRFPDKLLDGHNELELEREHLVMAQMYRVFVYLCDHRVIEWRAVGSTALGHFVASTYSRGVEILMSP